MSSQPLQNYTKTLSPPVAPDDVKRCRQRETPDLLKINCKNFNENQIVDTSFTDPVISRTDYAQFTLDRGRGILHSNSHILLGVRKVDASKNADDGKVFFPTTAGIFSQLDRCVLRSGTNVIQEVRDASHYYTMKAQMDTNEDIKNRYVVTEGRMGAYEAVTDVINVGGVISNGSEYTSQIFVDNGLENTETYTPDAGKNENSVTNHNKLVRGVQILNNGSQFAIPLATLFPCLRQFSLPLFMTEEPIIIELYFTGSGNKNVSYTSGSPGTDLYEVDPTVTQLMADYINYSEEIMNEFKEKNQSMALNFTDYHLVKSNNNFNTTSAYTTNLGGSGKIIDDIFISYTDLESVDNSKSVLNNYKSEDIVSGAAKSEVSVNLRVNDRNLFPQDVKNISEQYQNLLMAEGLPYNITGTDYAKGAFGTDYSTRYTLELYNIRTELEGQRRYMGIRNSRAEERINNNGVDLVLRTVNGNAVNAVVRAYVGIRRALIFRGGRFFTIDL